MWSIAVYFYESCSILASPNGESKIQMMSKNLQRYYTQKCLIRDLLSNVFVSLKSWLAKVFDLSSGRGNETSTNIVWYLYSFRALFVLYEAELDTYYSTIAPFYHTREKERAISIYVICRLEGPYSEKLWPRSWKCCPRPQAEGSIFKSEVTVFHYTERP